MRQLRTSSRASSSVLHPRQYYYVHNGYANGRISSRASILGSTHYVLNSYLMTGVNRRTPSRASIHSSILRLQQSRHDVRQLSHFQSASIHGSTYHVLNSYDMTCVILPHCQSALHRSSICYILASLCCASPSRTRRTPQRLDILLGGDLRQLVLQLGVVLP